MIYDFCIIGGGIVGLSTAMRLLELEPGSSLVLLEKEARLAVHQTGHNSGVIHSGLYYAPGSLKARLCREGATATKRFCREHAIPFEECGKLVVATNDLEVARLGDLEARAAENGLAVERLDAFELKRREPNVAGLAALLVPSTAIVDYRAVSAAMAERIRRAGGRIELGSHVVRIAEGCDVVTTETETTSWRSRTLIACAGLQSDRIARIAGLRVRHRIVPFRGEYFQLPADRNAIVRHLIYPVPDPGLPFLGVHLTRMMDGSVTVGPNAVLGMSREGYGQLELDLRDIASYASFGGFWKMLGRNLGTAVTELRNSIWRRGYLEQCRKYCPSLDLDDLLPHAPGVRAQAVMADGSLAHDFLFDQTKRMLHVLNAPSPAATSAIPIGDMIATKALAVPSSPNRDGSIRQVDPDAKSKCDGGVKRRVPKTRIEDGWQDCC